MSLHYDSVGPHRICLMVELVKETQRAGYIAIWSQKTISCFWLQFVLGVNNHVYLPGAKPLSHELILARPP